MFNVDRCSCMLNCIDKHTQEKTVIFKKKKKTIFKSLRTLIKYDVVFFSKILQVFLKKGNVVTVLYLYTIFLIRCSFSLSL